MDIRKKTTSLHETITRFTLRATASAILSFHGEAALAVSCPAYITTNSGLAGLVCDFDVVTGSSVTVEQDGIVGGINMASYSPASSSITINAGGTVSNNVGLGIAINSSSLTNGISNSGTISTHDSGILINNQSTISGGIFNSGAMSSTSGTGIRITNSSTINGALSNSGTIETSGVFVGITLSNNILINGNITNSGLIQVDNGSGILMRSNSTIAGGIFNSGTIRSNIEDGIAIFNSSNIQGNISNSGLISGGTQALSIHNASTLSGSILNTGTMRGEQNGISIFSSTTISGSISNSGTISGGGSGVSISSSAVVNGGISNSGTIQGDINAINIAANSNLSHLDILGQSARIIGAVEAANTTVNITNGALFTSEGSYHVNTFNISSNALFNMANTITATTLNNSGTLALVNTLQTLVGDYVQQSGGLMQTGISSTSNYGQLSATGAVDLSQSGDIYVQLNQQSLLHEGDVFSNIISGTTFISPGNGFNVNDNSYIWTFIPSLNTANNGLNLTARINPAAYNACQGTYCQSVATAILGQVAAGNPLFSPYAVLSSASALYEAASQATPELTNENIQLVQLATRAVLDVVPMWDNLRGRSSGNAMLYQPGKVWIKPYGGSMTQNERNTIPGFDATAYGAVIGKDIQLTNDWLFGGGFAAGGDTMHGKSILSGQSLDSTVYQGIIYTAKRLPHHVYFAGQGLVGYGTNDTRRAIPLYASIAKGSYSSWFTNVRAETGWNIYVPNHSFVFTPKLDASYLFVNQNTYRESGSPMDLLVASNNNSSLILGAYGNGAYHLTSLSDQRILTLTGYVGVAGDVINSQPQITSTFLASGSSFSTFGVSFNGAMFRGGAGLSMTSPISPLAIELNYDLQAGNHAYSGIGAATVKYKT